MSPLSHTTCSFSAFTAGLSVSVPVEGTPEEHRDEHCVCCYQTYCTTLQGKDGSVAQCLIDGFLYCVHVLKKANTYITKTQRLEKDKAKQHEIPRQI